MTIRLDGSSGPLSIGVIVCDLDRTLTNERLRAVPAALAALRRLRAGGIRTILASGRTKREIARRRTLLAAFDDVVLEGGGFIAPTEAVAPGGRGPVPDRETLQRLDALALWLSDQGIEHARGMACLSVDRRDEPVVRSFPQRAWFDLQANVDRLDVTMAGVNKGSGLRRLLKERPAQGKVLAFGDGRNDLPLFEAADYRVAVQNADPRLKRMSDEVTDDYGGRGVAQFLEDRLLRRKAAFAPAT